MLTMSISTPPVAPPQKKSGMGCLGCGCLILALLVLLFLGLVGGGAYVIYAKALDLTSTTPASIPTFKQKVAEFNQDVKNHQPATIHLTGDEINALAAHTPSFAESHVQLFVTISGDTARAQISLPTDQLVYGLFKGRYLNLDMNLGVSFDPSTKSINFEPHSLKMNDKVILDENASSDSGSDSNDAFNKGFMRSFTPTFNQSFNNGLRQSPAAAAFLDQVKSMEFKDGELVIETQ